MFRTALPLLCSVAVVSCTVVGQDYTTPSIDLSAQFVGGGSTQIVDAASAKWWQQLRDPYLNQLVEKGAKQNLDILTALERINQAEAALGLSGVNAQASGGLTANAGRGGIDGTVANATTSQIDGRFVLDLFGGVARGQEQAAANFRASQMNAGAVRLAYLADITSAYINARYFQEAAAISRGTIQSRRQNLGLVNQRREAGEATELEVQRAQAQLAAAEAGLPLLVASFETSVFRIATLLAEPAGPIMARMQAGAAQPRPHGFTTIGLPADLLRNRPDIQAAERRFAAATAGAGVAEAQLYPSVSIGGSIGTGVNDTWSFGPTVSIPILNRGFLRASQLSAESEAKQAELAWRRAVMGAVEEVQSSLTLCLNWRRQLSAQERSSDAARTVRDLSRDSYRAGAITLTDVLDAESAYANDRLAVADALRNYTLNWMQVQITTGQGWLNAPSATQSEVMRPNPRPDPLGMN